MRAQLIPVEMRSRVVIARDVISVGAVAFPHAGDRRYDWHKMIGSCRIRLRITIIAAIRIRNPLHFARGLSLLYLRASVGIHLADTRESIKLALMNLFIWRNIRRRRAGSKHSLNLSIKLRRTSRRHVMYELIVCTRAHR